MTADHGKIAYDRLEIIDALHRWALGLDTGDRQMLTSALAKDVIVDFTQVGGKTGTSFPPIRSRDTVVQALISTVGTLDTTHSVSNVRVTIDGDQATLQALVLAQHFPPSQGPNPDPDPPRPVHESLLR